jgi:hypothetical protein
MGFYVLIHPRTRAPKMTLGRPQLGSQDLPTVPFLAASQLERLTHSSFQPSFGLTSAEDHDVL